MPTFVPLAWETGGRWGDKAARFFREAVDRAGGSQSDKASSLAYWMRRFSVRFAKEVVSVRRRRLARFSAGGHRSRVAALVSDAYFAEQDASPFAEPFPMRRGP